MSKYYSQYEQDKLLHKNYFKDYMNGIFIDVGAYDGKTFNNTLFFEENYNWKGINIEPIPTIYEILVINRPNCIILNCAVDSENGNTKFILNTGYTEILSGLEKYYDKEHLVRRDNEIDQYGGDNKTINVQTKRLETIFDNYNITNINYLSIDVEGGENAVILSINFDKVYIDIIEFENNYKDSSNTIMNYLQSKGYICINNIGTETIMIHYESKFI